MLGLRTCCGCYNLKTGTIIIGLVGFVSLFLIFMYFELNPNQEAFLKLLFTIGGIIIHTSFLEDINPEDTRDHVKLIIIYSYIFCAVNVLLLYGAFKENKYLLLPWIAYVGFGLGLCTLFCLIFMFFVPGLTAVTLISVLLWYLWYCVVSFYNDLNIPTSSVVVVGVYPGIAQVSSMASSVVSYHPQPPNYDYGKGPQVV